jgi:hypothetical protein
MSNAIAPVAIPPAAGLGFYLQVQGLAIGPGIFLAEPFQHGGKHLFRGRLDVDLLFNVECQIFQFHAFVSSIFVM